MQSGVPMYIEKNAGAMPASCGDPAEEQKKFNDAVAEARSQLWTLFESAKKEMGEEQALIIDVQRMILCDLDFLKSVEERIKAGAGAAEAVQQSGDAFSAVFAAVEDEYIRTRAVDVRDAVQRVVHILCGQPESDWIQEPCILLAEDLTPSETVQMPKDKNPGFCDPSGVFHQSYGH
ncbi:phosphoenolpyruvate--protein phosphotransferase, partial [gut metagenome]